MRKETVRKVILCYLLIAIVGLVAGYAIGWWYCEAHADDGLLTCYILCKPGAQVNVRMHPDKGSREVGFLEVGDSFKTDGESRNGFIHAVDVGDAGDAWIYCGYVVTDPPEAVAEKYICVARRQVACRRWINGPQVEQRPWLKSGTEVQVFYRSSEWCVTSRGYVMSEWLEPNPS